MKITDLNHNDHFCFERDLERFGMKSTPIFILDKNNGFFNAVDKTGIGVRRVGDFTNESVCRIKATFQVVKEKVKYVILDADDIIEEGDEYFQDMRWTRTERIGGTVGKNILPYRRKVS